MKNETPIKELTKAVVEMHSAIDGLYAFILTVETAKGTRKSLQPFQEQVKRSLLLAHLSLHNIAKMLAD